MGRRNINKLYYYYYYKMAGEKDNSSGRRCLRDNWIVEKDDSNNRNRE